jgi:chromosome segregation ATPase
MRSELEVAQKSLRETREEVSRLEGEVTRLRRESAEAEAEHRQERERLRVELRQAINDREATKLRQQELEDRVQMLEAITGSRPAPPDVGPSGEAVD